jgi:hypothetical protein
MKGLLAVSRMAGLVPVLTGMLVLLTGCSGITKYPLVIDQQAPGSVTVDVIGATPSEVPTWQSFHVGSDWLTSAIRQDADAVTFRLKPGDKVTLAPADSHWATWTKRGVSALVVIADLPFTEEATRLQILSLNSKDWNGDQLEIQILRSGIRVMTPEKVK